MLRLAELRRAARVLEAQASGLRVDKLARAGEHGVVLTLAGRGASGEQRVRRHVLVTCAPGTARVSELPARPAGQEGEDPASWPPFLQLLRSRLLGARLAGARLLAEDRQLALRFEGAEGAAAAEGAEAAHELLLSVLGNRSNLYLLDGDERVVGWLRPLESTLRTLSRGERFVGPPPPASPPSTASEDRFADVPDDALLLAIESRYAGSEATSRRAEQVRVLETALAREALSLARKAEVLHADVREGADPERDARRGELLKSALREIRPGQERIVVRDPVSEEPVEIPLDPALGPSANLERWFQRVRKARRRAERAAVELGALAARADAVRAQEETLREILARGDEPDPAALDALAAQPPLRDLLARRARGAAAQTPPAGAVPARRRRGPLDDVPPRLRPRRYRSHEGLEIWVGRSDAGNDHLSTRLARGNDLFLHVDGAGSHVVLRTEGRRDAPQESLLEACELAVHFSKQRGASRVAVLVAPAKGVTKPRGSKPGLVHVRGGREIVLRHDPARLARVLGARIEEGRETATG